VEHTDLLAGRRPIAQERVPRWVAALLAGGLETPLARPALLLGPDAEWFRMANTQRQDLRRRKALRAILWGLARSHGEHPGAALSLDDLLAIGWPGQRVVPCAGANRVHVALTTLRNMGLRGQLILRRNGYLLDPALRVEHVTNDESIAAPIAP